MNYKRPIITKPAKPHPLHEEFQSYGQINTETDQAWIIPHLQELHEEGRYALHGFETVVKEVQSRDYSEYRQEVAFEKRKEPILKAQRAALSYLKKHITKAKSDAEAVRNKILRVTEPETFSDPTKAMIAELRNQEIRALVRAIDPKHRHDLIAGNLAYIQALVDAPDDIINRESLAEMRRSYAFQKDATLLLEEADTAEIAMSVRKRAAEISATMSKMLIDAKLDNPLPPAEFFDTFEPEDDYAKHIASKRIQSWERQQSKLVKDKEFDENNKGINLGSGERVARIQRGIPH